MMPYDLGRASCVCRKWRYTVRNPMFWRNACLKAWQTAGVIENYKILQSKYDGSWRKMWLLRSRVRTDGNLSFFILLLHDILAPSDCFLLYALTNIVSCYIFID